MNAKKNDETAKTKGRPRRFCHDEALTQAMGIFCNKGFEAASIAELGAAMNMKPPSLYNAFGDKERLFIDVLEHYHAPYEAMVQKIFKEAPTALEAVKNLLALSKEFHAKKQAVGCLIVNSAINVGNEASPVAEAIKRLHDSNELMIRERLEQGQKNGDFNKAANPTRLARYINGILQGAAVLARGQQSPDAVIDFIDQGYESFVMLAIAD